MNIKEALKWGTKQLYNAGVDFPELDAELLLLHAFHSPIRANWRMNRAWLYAHPEQTIKPRAVVRYKKLIARRARREPLAYILGHKEFYGLEFLVNRHVLIPRPETETLVEEALSEIKNQKSKIKNVVVIDIGTGSGAIVVALAVELRMKNVECRTFATDVSEAALRVARKNARRHGVEKQIKFLPGNLLAPLSRVGRDRAKHETTDAVRFMIIANLPYLPTAEWRATAPEIKKCEPRGALDGGKDGLRYYREMFRQLSQFMSSQGSKTTVAISHHSKRLPRSTHAPLAMTVIVEFCPEQVSSFKNLVRNYFPHAVIRVVKDLSGRNRVAVAKI